MIAVFALKLRSKAITTQKLFDRVKIREDEFQDLKDKLKMCLLFSYPPEETVIFLKQDQYNRLGKC